MAEQSSIISEVADAIHLQQVITAGLVDTFISVPVEHLQLADFCDGVIHHLSIRIEINGYFLAYVPIEVVC